MQLSKNWFYLASQLKSSKIEIWENLAVNIFDDDLSLNKEIIVWSQSILNIFSCINNDSYNLSITHEKQSKSNINILALWSSDTKIKVYSNIAENNAASNLNIISLVNSNDSITIDSKIIINKWVRQSFWEIKQENIFLWDSWKIESTPGLEIKSSESKASHSLKVEKISNEKLFYLRSRWIDKENATMIMLESLINSSFQNLWKDIFEEKIYKKFKNYVYNK